MDTAVAPRSGSALQEKGPSSGLTGCRVAGIALGALLLGIVLSQVPDLIRYFRISNM